MDELNDVEVGKILASCELTIGTRLHSVIIMMNSSIYVRMCSTLNVSILNDCAAEPGNPMNYRIPSRVHPDLNQYYDKTEWIQYF
ncbi:hypothetical protein LNA48_004713 [Escherichia coli]|nr:hypothetical protein [Escherichia coli]EJC2644370.1 hypothetical protein [Escherichia coli]EJC2649071.1 hypothetical protein [Escherichia coli]